MAVAWDLIIIVILTEPFCTGRDTVCHRADGGGGAVRNA